MCRYETIYLVLERRHSLQTPNNSTMTTAYMENGRSVQLSAGSVSTGGREDYYSLRGPARTQAPVAKRQPPCQRTTNCCRCSCSVSHQPEQNYRPALTTMRCCYKRCDTLHNRCDTHCNLFGYRKSHTHTCRRQRHSKRRRLLLTTKRMEKESEN